MNNKERLENWNRKLNKVENLVEKLSSDKNSLENLLDEIKTNQNIKLNNLLRGLDLQKEIINLKDRGVIYEEKISDLKNKIKLLSKGDSQVKLEKINEESKLKESVGEKETEKASTEELFRFISKEFEPVKEYLQEKDEGILLQQLDELDKHIGKVFEQEKELDQKVEFEETPEIKIPSAEEFEKDVEKTKIEFEETQKIREQVKELFVDRKELKSPFRLVDTLKNLRSSVKLESSSISAAVRLIKKPIGGFVQKTKSFDTKKLLPKPSKLKKKLRVIKKPIKNAVKKTRKFNGKKLLRKSLRKSIKIKKNLRTTKKRLIKISKKARKVERQKLIRYALPIIMLIFIVSILLVSKPEITGYVILTEGKTYDDNLNLVINESGNYTWTIDKEGDIESIKASGKVKGNGTVKIYIEKDGERYLIFDNKEANTS